MSKIEYMKRHGMTIRPVTEQDRATARTDYQRKAKYIIKNSEWEWFSLNGSLKDMKEFNHYYNYEPSFWFMHHPARGDFIRV